LTLLPGAAKNNMSDDGRPMGLPLFPGYRASGVLLHVASLPSPYGQEKRRVSAPRGIELRFRPRLALVCARSALTGR
jgi:hypothetical protein